MSRVDLKVVLLGKEYGGKTSLVERYLHDRFQGDIPYQNTIGAAYGAKRLSVNGKIITMGIWDTAGSERYESMSKIYYRGASAAVICYDLTDDCGFERAQFWVRELNKNEEVMEDYEPTNCRIYLCGTKKDLIDIDRRARKVDFHSITDYAEEINAQVFETSSKTGDNVGNLFRKIADDYSRNPKSKSNENSLSLEESPQTTSGCCLTGYRSTR